MINEPSFELAIVDIGLVLFLSEVSLCMGCACSELDQVLTQFDLAHADVHTGSQFLMLLLLDGINQRVEDLRYLRAKPVWHRYSI